jgi:hypothetical protein
MVGTLKCATDRFGDGATDATPIRSAARGYLAGTATTAAGKTWA